MIVSLRKLSIDLGIAQAELHEAERRAGASYRSFDVRSLGSSKWRHIDHPEQELQRIQRRILRQVLERTELPSTMTGGLPGRSLIDHAEPHCNQAVVFTLDLADFFPSISDRRVYELFSKRLDYSPTLAGLLTRLTTLHHRLPQGASTSAYLAALATEPLHLALLDFARAHELKFTQFVDDLAFSGAAGAQKLMPRIIAIVQRHGFALARKKFDVMPAKSQQVVTGVVVNRGLSAGATRIQEIKEQLARYRDALFILSGEKRSLDGKLAFVETLRPNQAERLRRYALQRMPAVADHPQVLQASTTERRECMCSEVRDPRRTPVAEPAHQPSLPGMGRRSLDARPPQTRTVKRVRGVAVATSQIPLF